MGLFLQDICFLKELRDLELHFHGAPWSKVVDDMKRVLFSLEDDSTGPNVHDGGFIIVNTWDFFVLAHPFICFFFFDFFGSMYTPSNESPFHMLPWLLP